jgi:hypothetical protein
MTTFFSPLEDKRDGLHPRRERESFKKTEKSKKDENEKERQWDRIAENQGCGVAQ